MFLFNVNNILLNYVVKFVMKMMKIQIVIIVQDTYVIHPNVVMLLKGNPELDKEEVHTKLNIQELLEILAF